jgi:biotin carboxyl carrier protein
MPTVRLSIYDRPREADVSLQGDRLHVTLSPPPDAGDAALPYQVDARVVHRDGPLLLLELTGPDGARRRVGVAAVRLGEKRQLWIDGRTVTAERTRPQGAARAAEGSLASAIPAVVAQLLVEPGDAVRAGDKLILLESMKMVIPIQAPHDGRVARILCAEGDSVPAGVPLVELEQR